MDVTPVVTFTGIVKDPEPCEQKVKLLLLLVAASIGAVVTVMVEVAVATQPPAVVPFTVYVVVADGLAYTVATDVPV